MWRYIIFCHWFDIEPEKHIWCQLAGCFANRLCCSGVCLRPHQFDGSRRRNTIYCCMQGDCSKGRWVGRLQAQVSGSKDSSYLWFQEEKKVLQTTEQPLLSNFLIRRLQHTGSGEYTVSSTVLCINCLSAVPLLWNGLVSSLINVYIDSCFFSAKALCSASSDFWLPGELPEYLGQSADEYVCGQKLTVVTVSGATASWSCENETQRDHFLVVSLSPQRNPPYAWPAVPLLDCGADPFHAPALRFSSQIFLALDFGCWCHLKPLILETCWVWG